MDRWPAAGYPAALDDARWAALASGPAFTEPDLGAAPHDLAAAVTAIHYRNVLPL